MKNFSYVTKQINFHKEKYEAIVCMAIIKLVEEFNLAFDAFLLFQLNLDLSFSFLNKHESKAQFSLVSSPSFSLELSCRFRCQLLE